MKLFLKNYLHMMSTFFVFVNKIKRIYSSMITPMSRTKSYHFIQSVTSTFQLPSPRPCMSKQLLSTNVWVYSPVSFFKPNHCYSKNCTILPHSNQVHPKCKLTNAGSWIPLYQIMDIIIPLYHYGYSSYEFPCCVAFLAVTMSYWSMYFIHSLTLSFCGQDGFMEMHEHEIRLNSTTSCYHLPIPPSSNFIKENLKRCVTQKCQSFHQTSLKL